MTKKKLAKLGRVKITLWVAMVILSLCVSFISSKWAEHSRNVNQFNLSVQNHDRGKAEKDLETIKKSYASFSELGLKYFADKYLFKDMYLYEAALHYVNEDYEKTIDLVSGHESDFRALSLRGMSKFRILHAAYHSEAAKKDKKIKEYIHGRVLEEVKPDFEQAVRSGPGLFKDFDSAFNYDLTSDPKSAKKALESMPLPAKLILGIKNDGEGPGDQPDRQGPSDLRLDNPAPGSDEIKKRG